MIDIIGHFFVLYPLVTFNKESNFFQKSNLGKFAVNLAILAVAAALTNVYLMDLNITQANRREQNLYEIFETRPQDFLNFNATTLKKRYRELSRKYHPDKNKDSSPEQFMMIKTAFETLNDPEKRKMYDVYGQVDFQQDDTMKNAFEVKFKNVTERQKHWEQYKLVRGNMRVFSDVVPYYLTWALLSIYRVDRASSYNILIGLTAVICYFEVQARRSYGTGTYDAFFGILYSYYPSNFTIGENMKLTRQLFPLLFQLVLIVCDFTLDAVEQLTEKKEQ